MWLLFGGLSPAAADASPTHIACVVGLLESHSRQTVLDRAVVEVVLAPEVEGTKLLAGVRGTGLRVVAILWLLATAVRMPVPIDALSISTSRGAATILAPEIVS